MQNQIIFNIYKNIIKYNFTANLLIEISNLYLLLPFFFAGGILLCFVYYKYKIEILLIILCCVIISYFLQNFYKNNNDIYYQIYYKFYQGSIFFIFGIITVIYRNYSIHTYNIYSFINNIEIVGQINEITLNKDFTNIILDNIYSNNIKINGKIRFKYFNDNINNLNKFCTIKIIGNIYPAKLYNKKKNNNINDKQKDNYNNYVKFNKIIANGKIHNIIDIDCNNITFFEKISLIIDKYRRNIQTRILKISNNSSGGGVLISILTGSNNFIFKDDLHAIRKSGCAHILAISGLHMAIIGSFITIIIRKFILII